MNGKWNDEQIHAFVDGELDAGTAALLEADSRTDVGLATRIARQRDLGLLLRSRFDPVIEEPVPQRLRDLAGASPGGTVTPIGAARSTRSDAKGRTRARWSLREWGAIAASVAMGAVLAQLFVGTRPGLPIQSMGDRLLATGALEAALNSQISGRPDAGSAASVTLSFRASSGEFCRVFTLRSGVGGGGLACQRDGRWTVELLEGGRTPPAGSDQFRQASSAFPPALRSAVEARSAGEPLSPEEESQQVARGWKASRP